VAFERYNTGYNVGVGGVVVKDGRVLLVRRSGRYGRGNWQIPGGFIERDETIDQAVIREVREEAGVETEIVGVLAVRSRYNLNDENTPLDNSLYIVFLLRPTRGDPTPDAVEVDQAGYFTLDEIEQLERVPLINKTLVERALSNNCQLLSTIEVSGMTTDRYRLFAG